MHTYSPSKRFAALAWPAALLFVALSYTFLYAFVHEGGHAMVGLAFGQRLVAFHANIFTMNAYVSMMGALSPIQRTLQSAAGHGLALVVWAFFMLLSPRRGDVLLRILKAASSVSILSSTAVWVVIPILYSVGNAPVGDDVTNVLDVSGLPPLLLILLAGVVLALGIILAVKKNQGLAGDLRLLRELRSENLLDERMAQALPRARRTFVGLALVGGAALLMLASMQILLPGRDSTGVGGSAIPPNYTLRAGQDLSLEDSNRKPLAEFTLSERGRAGVFIRIFGIDSQMFELALEGPDGYREILIRGLGYQADLDSASFEQDLPAGFYQVVLTHQSSPGQVEIYLLDK